MISVTAAKWTSGVFRVLGGVLVAAMLAYAYMRSGATSSGPRSSTTTSDSGAEIGILGMLFSSAAWSFCVAVGAHVLASSATAARALIRLGQPLGFALVFAGPMLWTSGSPSMTVLVGVVGLLVVVVSTILDFVFFGARAALKAIAKRVAEIEDAISELPDASPGSVLGEGLISPPPEEPSPDVGRKVL